MTNLSNIIVGQMDHFSHACLPWFVCVGLLAETGLGEDWELMVLRQNTLFSTMTLSSRSFALSSSNSEVTVSIANVEDPSSVIPLLFCLPFAPTVGWAGKQLLDRFVHGSWCTGRKCWCYCCCWVVQNCKYLYRHERIELYPGIY